MRDFEPRDGSYGSFASDQSRQHLRPMSALPPIATKLVRRDEVTLCAIRGLAHRGKTALSFDHLVGADHQRQRHVDAELNERRHPGYFPA